MSHISLRVVNGNAPRFLAGAPPSSGGFRVDPGHASGAGLEVAAGWHLRDGCVGDEHRCGRRGMRLDIVAVLFSRIRETNTAAETLASVAPAAVRRRVHRKTPVTHARLPPCVPVRSKGFKIGAMPVRGVSLPVRRVSLVCP